MKFTINVDADENAKRVMEFDRESSSIESDVATSCADVCESRVEEVLGNAPELARSEETKCSEVLPEYLKLLFVEGNAVCGDSRSEFKKPEWLDEEKLKRGQRFAVKYSFGVMYAEMLSLIILFAFQGGLGPLIYTGMSHTPFKAFKRYLSTAIRVKSWQEEDIWDESTSAHRNLKAVRCMHEAVRHRMTTSSQEDVAKKTTLKDDKGTTPMWTDLHEEVREDFQSSCPVFRRPSASIKVHVNQTDMAVTQFGFVGLILIFPKMFGVHGASDEDLDAFAHLWRTLGFCLGLEDRFNLCDGNLATVQQRCRDILNIWVKPRFFDVNRDWMHMSRVMVEGLSYYVAGTTFEVVLLYLCKVISIDAPKLYSSMSTFQKLMYYYTVYIYAVLLRLPGMLAFHNWLINSAIRRGLNKSPKELKRLETKMYPYETQPGVILCTKL